MAVITANYDQIWLFGFNTTALSGPEQTAIANFMQSGGGVFATGDHSSIGAGMGANLLQRQQQALPKFSGLLTVGDFSRDGFN
ncbi:MAG: hypothetical protein HC866_09275 [Leptolyngbyaceae cyanobacterium RU_5_1]|nr:hypothetical protein [Leptolyngbyaceae cyanobacterium RU_5_1]